MPAKSKLNSIETLISSELINLEIGHEEFKTIVVEKEKYEKNERMIKIREELNKEKGKKTQKNNSNNTIISENRKNAWN